MSRKKKIDWEVVRRMSAFVVCGIGLILTLIGLYVGLYIGIWTLCWVGLALAVAAAVIPAIVIAIGMLFDPMDGFWHYTLPNALFALVFVVLYIPYACIMALVVAVIEGCDKIWRILRKE